MVTGTLRGGRLLAAAATLLLGAGLVCPTPAAAGKWARRQARLASCPHNKSILRIDAKVCPATKRRHAITLRRACCVASNGHINCKPFVPCPAHSPS